MGSDAGLVIVNIHQDKKVTKDVIQSSSNFSVFDGWTFKGWPVLTLCRGKVILKE